MLSMHPNNLREKSKELYAKVQDSFDLRNPSRKYAGESLHYLKQAIMYMTFHVPKEQWTPDDYVHVMHCYHHFIRICMYCCKYNVEFYREVITNNQMTETSLNNINIDHGVLGSYVREANEYYNASITENKDNIEFHLAGCTALLQYYREYATGSLSLTAETKFTEELRAAVAFMERTALPILERNFQLTSLSPSQLTLLAECHEHIFKIYLLNREFDKALVHIMKMCEAISALPSPVDIYRTEKDSKSYNEFLAMYDAYRSFNAVFPENNDDECHRNIKELLHMAIESLKSHSKLTPSHVLELYNNICKQDMQTSLLQRQFMRHIIKGILANYQSHVMRANDMSNVLIKEERWVKEFGDMITRLEQLESARSTHSVTMFGKREGSLPGLDDGTQKSSKQAKIRRGQ